MLQPVLSVEQMRRLDEFVINRDNSGKSLMKKAGEALADELKDFNKIAVVCGHGNNGGDGYASICSCQERGLLDNKCVNIIFIKEPKSEESKFFFAQINHKNVNFKKFEKSSFSSILKNSDVIADCLLGTGFSGVPRAEIKEAIDAINEADLPVISMDINSGVNGDTGIGITGVKSDLTLSIGYYKIGMLKPAFKTWAKAVKNKNIGYELTKSNLEPFSEEDKIKFVDLDSSI